MNSVKPFLSKAKEYVPFTLPIIIETLINAGMIILVAIAILFIIPVAAIVITLASIPCSILEAGRKKGNIHE